ncbi:MAG: hypothetical protein HYZ57_02255 [Acidobacteria bacterium]|nr:hypothetical protein [Acidobacteriota bacterium]MBI3278645.1 hypothetical protein [Acidobacteriota bacterium]
MRLHRLAMLMAAAAGLSGAATKADPTTAEIDRIAQTFAANESAFARARENYTYRQTARIQEFDEAGLPGGKFEMVSDIIFSPEGKRTERVVRAPVTTLERIQMSPEDEQDLRNVMPFVLTAQEVSDYHVRYLGRQMADEIPCYVFAVKPRTLQPGKRYFTGQVWVDDRDLMIVKTYGRSIGLLKKGQDQQFPKFETYREQVDGKYWFPTYTVSNSTLHFQNNDVKVRLTVKYQDYKQFKSESRITVVDSVDSPPSPPKKQ